MTTKKNNEESKVTRLEGFQKNLKAKENILKRIEEIHVEEQRLHSVIIEKRQELKPEEDRLDQYLQELKSHFPKNKDYDEMELEKHERENLVNYRNSIITLQKSLSSVEAEKEALGEEKNGLEKALSDFDAEMTETDVLEYQKKVVKARKAVEDIMTIIENQTSLIEAARNATSLTDDLKERKEDILAEIALGKDLTKELEKITSDIETEMKRLAAQEKIISEAGKALPGLQRKLLIAKENLKKLENQKSEILLQYLRREAEQVGQEYGEAASILIDKYNRIVSLDLLMIQQGGKTIGGEGFHDFTIPAFQLNAFNSLISPRMPNELVTARMACTRENKAGAVTREKKRISDLGIEI
jgi:DNA repair exonuclease SbcCD ATPase subunit